MRAAKVLVTVDHKLCGEITIGDVTVVDTEAGELNIGIHAGWISRHIKLTIRNGEWRRYQVYLSTCDGSGTIHVSPPDMPCVNPLPALPRYSSGSYGVVKVFSGYAELQEPYSPSGLTVVRSDSSIRPAPDGHIDSNYAYPMDNACPSVLSKSLPPVSELSPVSICHTLSQQTPDSRKIIVYSDIVIDKVVKSLAKYRSVSSAGIQETIKIVFSNLYNIKPTRDDMLFVEQEVIISRFFDLSMPAGTIVSNQTENTSNQSGNWSGRGSLHTTKEDTSPWQDNAIRALEGD